MLKNRLRHLSCVYTYIMNDTGINGTKIVNNIKVTIVNATKVTIVNDNKVIIVNDIRANWAKIMKDKRSQLWITEKVTIVNNKRSQL